jgi:hypothetical protein
MTEYATLIPTTSRGVGTAGEGASHAPAPVEDLMRFA